ncbi:unnamed protein product [Diplocarpon coronariae]|uniref:Glucose receptor Git3-like N-terminal domain-containing protein n=1 Tax=Diplocarpon coronariae TaxID=2795749 RepID=A0A218YYC2_9HELO|nr:hypothetical protein B2J93_1460 [Marssonina coronariae]
MAVEIPLVVLNLTGSLLSVCGTLFILICYMILPQKRHIRHALIINLTVADCINAINNSSSGMSVLLKRRPLSASTACTVNGFVGQLSIQAVDFSILTITYVTMWIVTSNNFNRGWTYGWIVAFVVATWTVPLITSSIALGLGIYVPASSNWCWIEAKPVYQRYLLTHGWRFVIIAAVVSMCIYIQVYIRRHSRLMSSMVRPSEVQGWQQANNSTKGQKNLELSQMSTLTTSVTKASTYTAQHSNGSAEHAPQDERTDGAFTEPGTDKQEELMIQSAAKKDHQLSIQRAMLLHAYPILYIILWIPGISMRIVDATGGKSTVLTYMQASTQFIGIANALTFGWNEKIGDQLKAKFKRRFAG